MLKDKSSMFIVDGEVAITGEQAEACIRLLHACGADDLVDMLIDPDQIATADPSPTRDRPRRRSHTITAFTGARKVA